MPPKVIALRCGILLVCCAHAQDFLQNDPVSRRGFAKFNPIQPPPAIDDVVDGSGRERVMVKMPMLHTSQCTQSAPCEQAFRNRRCSSFLFKNGSFMARIMPQTHDVCQAGYL